MPRGGKRPGTGGKRPGAGRPRSRPTLQIELSEQATRELAYFLENQNLSAALAPRVVSEMVLAALVDEYDRWADRFGNDVQPE